MYFKDIIGQERIKQNLLAMAKSGKVSHAQLFNGPEGSGALALSIAFSRYILCENSGDQDSCGNCSSCSKIDRYIHPDLHFSFPFFNKSSNSENPSTASDFMSEWREALIANPYMTYYQWIGGIAKDNKQGNITAKECREIIRKLYYKSFEGGSRVLIIWMAEKLGKEGNILLKLIEEPPSNTFIFLVSEDMEAILNTIRSRTLLHRVPPIRFEAIKEKLVQSGEDDTKANELARLADGNYSLVLSQTESDLDKYLAVSDEWLSNILKQDTAACFKLVQDFHKLNREEQKLFIKYMLRKLEFAMRDLILKGGAAGPAHSLAEQLLANENFDEMVREFDKAYFYISRNAFGKLTYFNLSLRIMALMRQQAAVGSQSV